MREILTTFLISTSLILLSPFILLSPLAYSEDAVVYTHQTTGRLVQATGTIESYNRSELILNSSNGQIKTIQTEYIKEIKTERSAFFNEAILLMDSREFSKAAALFDKALIQTTESWKKQEILSKQIECLCNQNRCEEAALKYVNILQLDADSAYWDCVPLAWSSVELSSQMEQIALRWVRQRETPTLTLLGASFLLVSSQKSEAQKALSALEKNKDEQISTLAQMQLNRLSLTPMTETAIKNLEKKVDRLPKSLQFGARFITAQLWGRSSNSPSEKADKIAVNYLQCALNPQTPVELQARSLYSAGAALIGAGRQDEAIRIFQRLVQKFPDSQWAGQAKRTAGGKL